MTKTELENCTLSTRITIALIKCNYIRNVNPKHFDWDKEDWIKLDDNGYYPLDVEDKIEEILNKERK